MNNKKLSRSSKRGSSTLLRNSRSGFANNGTIGQSRTTYSFGGTPNVARMRLVYAVSKAISTTAGAVQDQVFSGNGCFDPDITAAGAQPTNYDDWSALYGRYRVYGSRCTVWPLSTGSVTAGTGTFRFCVAARHTTTAVTTTGGFDSAVTQPFADLFSVGAASGGGTVAPLAPYTASYSTSQVLGYEQSAVKDDDTLQALTSANPNHQWYWHIMVRSSDDSSTGVGTFYCRLEYDIEFFDRLDTQIDLSERVYRDLIRLASRFKREEKSGESTREKRSKFKIMNELLFEYKDQILSPQAVEEEPPRHIAVPALERTILVQRPESVSRERSLAELGGRDSEIGPKSVLRRS